MVHGRSNTRTTNEINDYMELTVKSEQIEVRPEEEKVCGKKHLKVRLDIYKGEDKDDKTFKLTCLCCGDQSEIRDSIAEAQKDMEIKDELKGS